MRQTPEDIQLVLEASLSRQSSPPAIVVFSVQEVAPIVSASFGQLDGYATPIRQAIADTLAKRYSRDKYRLAGESWVGAIGVCVYTHKKLRATSMQTANSGFGAMWSSLKAAAAVQLRADGKTFTFVSAHLAANEGYSSERNRQFAIMSNSLHFGDKPFYSTEKNNYMFISGDLNYRSLLPSPDDSTDVVTKYSPEIDELATEMKAGRTAWGLVEAPIKFAPTFKFQPGTSEYNLARNPSWCDRILYSDEKAEILEYSSVEEYCSSDHKPVFLRLRVSKQMTPAKVRIPHTPLVVQNLTRAADAIIGSAAYIQHNRLRTAALVGLAVAFYYFVS